MTPACACWTTREATLADLMEHISGPDFGGIIMGRSGIRAAYATAGARWSSAPGQVRSM